MKNNTICSCVCDSLLLLGQIRESGPSRGKALFRLTVSENSVHCQPLQGRRKQRSKAATPWHPGGREQGGARKERPGSRNHPEVTPSRPTETHSDVSFTSCLGTSEANQRSSRLTGTVSTYVCMNEKEHSISDNTFNTNYTGT